MKRLEIECASNRDVILGLPSFADNTVDHIVTDPPYEAEAHTQQRRIKTGSKTTESAPLDFNPITEDHRDFCCREFARICKGWVIVFCQAEAVGKWRDAMVSAGLKWRRACVWCKPNGQPQLTGDRPGTGYESMACAWAGSGKSSWNGGGKVGVYRVNIQRGRNHIAWHQTSKPLLLMEALIRDFTNPGDLVLDPFCGSGTTLVACRRLGRRAQGIEVNPEYVRLARARLEEVREQLGLFGTT